MKQSPPQPLGSFQREGSKGIGQEGADAGGTGRAIRHPSEPNHDATGSAPGGWGRAPAKICFISHWAGSGGAEQVLYRTISLLKDCGIDAVCTVPCAGSLQQKISALGIRCYRIPYRWWMGKNVSVPRRIARNVLNVAAALVLAALARKERCDLLYSNTSTIYVGALAAWFARIPHVWHVHEYGYEHGGMTFDLGFPSAAKLMDLLSSRIITVSGGIGQKYVPFVSQAKLRTLHNYVEVPDVVEPEERERPARLRLVIVGSLHEGKGQDEALRALSALILQGVESELIIVGDGEDDKYKRMLYNYVTSHGLHGYVQFRGQLSSPYEVMKSADCILMCSRFEGFSLVIIEAMLLGRVVVAANSGSVIELIENGVNGFTYEPGHVDELVEKIRQISLDAELARAVAENGARWARATFSMSLYRQRLCAILSEAACA